MSYILRALKKSEEERTKGTVPRVTTVHGDGSAGKSRFWAILAVVALVVLAGNAMVLGLGLWDGDGERRSASSTSLALPETTAKAVTSDGLAGQTGGLGQGVRIEAVAQRAESPVPEATDSSAGDSRAGDSGAETPGGDLVLAPAAAPQGPGESGTGAEAARVRVSEATPAPAADPLPEPAPSPPPRKPAIAIVTVPAATLPADTVEPLPTEPLAADTVTADPMAADAGVADPDRDLSGQRVAALESPAAAPSPSAVYRSVPELWQLPSQFRSQVPALAISVHVYSPDELRRFVIIDRRKYWEGDLLEGGVLLEAILPEGIVLEYQGRQFRLRST